VEHLQVSLRAVPESELPRWSPGAVLILVTQGTQPHAIPVSAAVRAGPRRALLGLAHSRESLTRLRAAHAVGLVILGEGDVAVTAYGVARVRDPALTDGVAAVEVEVSWVQDHNRDTFEIESGVGWRWTDEEAQRRDAELRAALARLAEKD
jgi:hypothetical protein